MVITDITMPGMTGDRLAIEIMKIRADILEILSTGYSKRISQETACDLNIRALIYKPIVRAELAKALRKVLDEVKGRSRVLQNNGKHLLVMCYDVAYCLI